MTATNLNDLAIETDCRSGQPQRDHAWVSPDGLVAVHFKHLERRLVELIDHADYVVGCVAWLTHPDILGAMAGKRGVSIIVQKEDWLRPDFDASGRAALMRPRYASLTRGLSRYDRALIGTTVHMMSCCGDDRVQPVRCVGNHNADRHPASPRSHHKFVVLCRASDDAELGSFVPYAVWTGSFNFTVNATRSFDNAVVLRHPDAVRAYFREWGQVAALSEPLDWESEWAAPEWRIGT